LTAVIASSRWLACTVLVGALALLVPAADGRAATSGFAPIDRPGAPLSVPAPKLAASLVCTATVTNARRAPVLLLSGTGGNDQEYYPWNWEPVLTRAGIPWCTSDVADGGGAGDHNLADMQTRGEYITYAIRTMYSMARRRISILGHSQGGSVMRWSLRFWPDTRRMVDDVIGLEGANHGAVAANPLCLLACPAIAWQLREQSNFNAAMNSFRETFPGISYTTVRSDVDALMISRADAELHGPGMIANLRTQDKCPGDLANHGTLWFSDPVAEAIVMDALDHPGPAKLSRISPSVCFKLLMSGLNPQANPPRAGAPQLSAVVSALAPVPAEPPLACYTLRKGCR
jgi:hypothetical protein